MDETKSEDANPVAARHQEAKAKALGMGGPRKLARLKEQGLLNARERLAQLFDPGTVHEVGLFSTSHRAEDRDATPADGKITAFGLVRGRRVASVVNDLTVKGASSSLVNGRKIAHMRRAADQGGMPLVFLAESSGARMPDSMGAAAMGFGGQDPHQYCRARETPWVSALLGPCFGSSVWYAAMSDFVVMRKGAIMAVSSPKVTAMAVSQGGDADELGGWKLHAETTGMADAIVETDEEAINLVKAFLSYLPSHAGDAPPRVAAVDAAGPAPSSIVPTERGRVYDARKLIAAVADEGSVFAIKDRFGRSVATCLARIDGQTVGFLASNPMFKGGALDPDACDKATSFIVLCDSFSIPLIMLVDTPGFLIGLEGERRKAPGKIMNFMHAVQLASVPKISVITRKSYGQAYLNLGGGRNSDESAAWTIADVSFVDPEIGARVVHGVGPESDPKAYAAAIQDMTADSSAYALASVFGVHGVIEPDDTRAYLTRALNFAARRNGAGLSSRRLASWPTTL